MEQLFTDNHFIYYSFGHEIAHGFGLAHDRRVATTSSNGYAFGNIILVSSFTKNSNFIKSIKIKFKMF